MFKKLSVLLVIFAGFVSLPVWADDSAPVQETENNQTYFTANIQKQPQSKGSKQGIKNHFTFFTINVNVNGKVLNYQMPEEYKKETGQMTN